MCVGGWEEAGNYAGKIVFLIFFWKCAWSRERTAGETTGKGNVLIEAVHCASPKDHESVLIPAYLIGSILFQVASETPRILLVWDFISGLTK